MAFFLTEEQEIALNEFINRENTKICESQILEDSIPQEFRDLIQKTIDSGSPVPFFDPLHGYYSVSFTPCEKGNRIYVHHHLTGVSEAIYDPSTVTIITEDVVNESDNINDSEIDTNTEIDNIQLSNEHIPEEYRVTNFVTT
jgi:hypothetical protein